MQIKDGIKESEQIFSFLLIGQSNMAGRGELGDVPPIVNPDCRMLRMGRWQRMAEPVNPDRDIFSGRFHSGIGPQASFADAVARTCGVRVGIIPCADGGTSLDEWREGSVLYDHALMMSRLAMRTSRLCGILWHQGESDCRHGGVETYFEKFTAMITALRRDLGQGDLPLLIGELSAHYAPEWQMGDMPLEMNAVFARLAATLPSTAVVPAADLPLKEDGLHFNAHAQRELGRRYAAVYTSLAGALPSVSH
ncbi:MAG: sialate O-acetylesterase [Ruminococcaceae bacterium]|nr:sialate O-acetylesterase [Oscillospiraceae bacterium]